MSEHEAGEPAPLPTPSSSSASFSAWSPRPTSSSFFSALKTSVQSAFRSSPGVAPSLSEEDEGVELPTLADFAKEKAAKQQRHLTRLKHIAAHSELRKTLGWRQLVSLGIGCTIGAGIFVVTGQVGRNQTGPALFLAYIVSGLTCLLAALCYAEFAAMSPSAGSAYSYARGTMGELVGWIIGWDLILEYGVGSASVAQSWSSHLNQLLQLMGGYIPNGIDQPWWGYNTATGSFSITGSGFDLFAVLITVVVTCVLYRGIKESARFNNVMVITKLSVVLFVILVGSAYVSNSNYSPFMPFGFAGISFFGHTAVGQTNGNGDPSGVLAGAAIVFFAYIGFDAVSCQSEECKEPQRDLPIGIIGSLGVSTLLYVAVSLVLVGMVPYSTLDPSVAVSAAFGAHNLVWAEYIIDIGALVGMTSVILVTSMGQPRVMLAMARDGLLPMSFFGAIHPKYGTPYKSTVLTGVFVSLLSSLVPLSVLVELVSIGTLMAFFVVCVSVIVLRYTQPDLLRPFRCPWSPFIPGLGAFLCLMLMLSLPGSNWYRLLVWLAIGLAVYYGWGRNNARKLKERVEAEEKAEMEREVEEGEGEGEKKTEDAAADKREAETLGEKAEDESKEEVNAADSREKDAALVYEYDRRNDELADDAHAGLNDSMRASDD